MREMDWKVEAGLFGIVFIVSVPLMVNYCIDGIDVSFYLRLFQEGGAENVFFLLPSLFVRAGIPGETVYKLLLFVINVITALTAYGCFRYIFTDEILGLTGSMLYTWLPYRLNDLYSRGDLGEALSMAFLPLLFLGLYRLFAGQGANEGSGYGKLWVLLSVGYSLVFQSYILSFVTAVIFTALLGVVQWRKILQKATAFVLLKTVLAFCVMNLWTFVLLLYRYRAGQFPLVVAGNGKIQSRGVYLVNFLQLYFQNGRSRDMAEQGMRQLQPYGLGFAVTVGLLVYLWLWFVGKYKDKKENERRDQLVRAFFALGILLAFMTTNCFPWDMLQGVNRLFHGAVACLYEPTRFMPFVALCLIAVVCGTVWRVRRWENRDRGRCFLLALVVIAFVGTQYLTGDILSTGEPRSLYGMPYGAPVTEAEYEPANLDISPIDYAKYESSRYWAPFFVYVAEAATAVGVGILSVLIWRKRRVEKSENLGE